MLITGALLHDIGKLEELDVSTHIKVTNKGIMLGHITIGVQILSKAFEKLGPFLDKLIPLFSRVTPSKLLQLKYSLAIYSNLGVFKASLVSPLIVILIVAKFVV